MSFLLRLAGFSAWNRRTTLGLMLLAIALSTTLLLSIERLRHDVRSSFTQSVSGTDLIVGARTSPIQLLLYSVFRIGGVTNNMGWNNVATLSANPLVDWVIPLSLGDSHRGFPVLATNAAYFQHYRFGNKEALVVRDGKPFAGLFDTVIGAEVAARLNYKVGDKITLSHGTGSNHLQAHDDKPFTVTGILQRTGTAVDRTVHIGLDAMEAIHLDWQGGTRMAGFQIPAEFAAKFDLTPKSITAVLVGLHNRTTVFSVQREINTMTSEPLMAVLPGVALDELWQITGIGENILFIVSMMVVVIGLAGLVAVILSGLGERRRELAILRSTGARPLDIFLLLAIEGVGVMIAGVLSGLVLLTVLIFALSPLLMAHFGVTLRASAVTYDELVLLGKIVLAGCIASVFPALRAYRLSLSDGLTPRI
jgi:putative ABC transport system permease protein